MAFTTPLRWPGHYSPRSKAALLSCLIPMLRHKGRLQKVITVTDMLTKIATTSEHLRGVRNVILDVLDPMTHSRLAWRLSLLGYEKEIRENIQLA